MTRCLLPVLVALALAAGCTDLGGPNARSPADFFKGSTTTPAVSANPFSATTVSTASSQSLSCPPATAEAANRVNMVAQKVLTANPQLGFRPVFITIGAPHNEIFHRGTATVTITEGLVKQCNGDGQLAAVLCTELGKMSAERNAAALAQKTPRFEPMDVRVGNDYGGSIGPADKSDLADRLKLERDFAPTTTIQPPDPHALAQAYLIRTGYPASDLEVMTPLLSSAEGNSQLEKQLNGTAR